MTTDTLKTPFLTHHTSSRELSAKARIIIGALLGVVLGVLYAFFAGTIDVLIMRDVPLRVDWITVLVSVVATGFGCAVLGGITSASVNPFKGVLHGALAMIAYNLVQSFLQPDINAASLVLVLLYLALPLFVLILPLTIILRLALYFYERTLENDGRARRMAQARVLIILAAFAAFAGSWAQMPPEAREAVRRVDNIVRDTLTSEASASLPLSLRDVNNFRERASQKYQLDQQKSISTANGTDVHVYFDTGLVMTCVADHSTRSILCKEGKKNPFGKFNPFDQR
jgi:glucan phosphoethanolaminetransferase (alkaline phosphatase superfamily)